MKLQNSEEIKKKIIDILDRTEDRKLLNIYYFVLHISK